MWKYCIMTLPRTNRTSAINILTSVPWYVTAPSALSGFSGEVCENQSVAAVANVGAATNELLSRETGRVRRYGVLVPPSACLPTHSCAGHYTCDSVSGARLCMPGYTGQLCRQWAVLSGRVAGLSPPACPDGRPCHAGGSCFDGRCCCLDGFTGVHCEVSLGVCESNPCRNGGVCQNAVGQYTCYCLPGKLSAWPQNHVTVVIYIRFICSFSPT